MQFLFYLIIAFQIVLIFFATDILLRLFLIVIGWNQQLPFVPTTNKAIQAIIADGALDSKQVIIDLGSGTGTMIAQLRQAYPTATLIGVEHSYMLVILSRLRFILKRNRPQFIHGDIFEYDIRHADAIVGFWITSLIPRLQEKCNQELQSGTVIVSNLFEFPKSDMYEGRRVDFGKKGKFFVYKKS